MPDKHEERRRETEFKLEREINEMHFKVGVALGYKKAIEDTNGSTSNYRVEEDLE